MHIHHKEHTLGQFFCESGMESWCNQDGVSSSTIVQIVVNLCSPPKQLYDMLLLVGDDAVHIECRFLQWRFEMLTRNGEATLWLMEV